ncbi:unnamed protein product [Echinostoma caproni]|uniref:Nephrin n=1 Tax=Echinostoma caproni TaxID=27848 RepID=A0A183A787_9TREM|nr:unnamed protein product [Echinostoma caproni]
MGLCRLSPLHRTDARHADLPCYKVDPPQRIRDDSISSNRRRLTLTVEPNELIGGLNQSILLRCLLSRVPSHDDSVYVIWRFRHSREPPPPANWAFMHQDDDIARCPEPPGSCELVNQYGKLKTGMAELNARSSTSSFLDRDQIARRQLHTLRLHQITWKFDGTFQCYVLLNLDAMEARTSLRVLSAPRHPTFIQMIKEASEGQIWTSVKDGKPGLIPQNKWKLTVGKSHYFACVVYEANPQAQVTWIVRRRDGTLRTLRMNQPARYNYIKWRPFDAFVDLKESDDLSYLEDEGLIECRAENSVGKASSAQSMLDLNFAPVIQPFPSPVIRILENGNLSVNCLVQAKPTATVRWSDGQKRNVSDPPVVQVRSNITANVGERLEVSCRVDANPPATTVYWSFTPTGHHGSWNETSLRQREGNQLLLASVRREHEGMYTCHAVTVPKLSKLLNSESVPDANHRWWQSRATSSASLRLVVNYTPGQPSVSILSPKPILEGSLVRIQCLVNSHESGFPKPKFHWIRRSLLEMLTGTQTVLQSPSMHLETQANGSTLRINSSVVADSGIYTCYARNVVGISPPSEVLLSVEGKPCLIEGPPATQTFIATPPVGLMEFTTENHLSGLYLAKTKKLSQLVPAERSYPRVVLTCNFVSNSKLSVQWMYRSQSTTSNKWMALQPVGPSSAVSLPSGYALETHANLLPEVNLWHIRAMLTIPQTGPSSIELDPGSTCTFKHASDLLQREAIDANYACVASNPYGVTQKQSQVTVVLALLNPAALRVAWTSEHTFFTAMWIKRFTQANSTIYQCHVANSVGNRTVARSVTVPCKYEAIDCQF